MEKIFLKKGKSKNSLNSNSFVSVNFKSNQILLPSTSIDSILNLKEQYDTERENCNTIRLVCTINPLCTNALYNNKSEVVINEGSDEPIVSLYHNFLAEDAVLVTKDILKSNKTFVPFKLIQDTQLSQYENITYHCGLDIFNNHILRNSSFKSVTLPKSTSDASIDTFNTIRDWLRNYHGSVTKGYADIVTSDEDFQEQLSQDTKMHLYINDDIDTFKNTAREKLREKNGWIGFYNTPTLPSYDSNNVVVPINKPINNRNACEFIDLYPNRELFYFTPIYNKYRHRIEKNWNYCLTYPSSSITNVAFINSVDDLNALKIGVYDDDTFNSKGISSILIYSTCKHGLTVNDTINVYETVDNSNVKRINGAFVNEIVDDYSFYITKNGESLSRKFVEISGKSSGYVETWISENDVNSDNKVNAHVYSKDGKYYPIINGKINLNDNNMQMSFVKVVNSVECKYYVRIFSRLPNWKFVDRKVTEYEMYNDKSNLILQYQQLSNDFESHCGQAGFARNVYNDEISEIVFTDDINISNLKDNLGRPVTSIYLTILKNNRGYKDWHNVTSPSNAVSVSNPKLNNDDLLKNNDTLEYSHCFGKLSCGFKLSYESLINKDLSNILRVSSEGKQKVSSLGLDCKSIGNLNRPSDDVYNKFDDEVMYRYYDTKENALNLSGDVNFYGDVVCFSPSEFNEESLDMGCFRFNTAQRDYIFKSNSYYPNEHVIVHDEFHYDDYDQNPNPSTTDGNFLVVTESGFTSSDNSMKRDEGYYYKGHYEIPIHTFSSTLSVQTPKFYVPKSFSKLDSGEILIKTMDKTYLELNDKFYLYDATLSEDTTVNEDDKYYVFTVTKVLDRRRLYALPADGKTIDLTHKFKMFKPDETIPSYAYLLKDKSFRFIWREVLHNGTDSESDIETYPFTNNALYVNKSINFYLKRQDPNNYVKDYAWDGYTLHSAQYPYDIDIKKVSTDSENKYYEEDDIEC